VSQILRLHPNHRFREPAWRFVHKEPSAGWCGVLLGEHAAEVIDQAHTDIERHRAAGTLRKLLSTIRGAHD